jgi:hypothetical protein
VEIEKLQKKEAETSRALREQNKELKRDIDSVKNRLKWCNIIGMPLVVAVGGIGLAALKRKRTSAK